MKKFLYIALCCLAGMISPAEAQQRLIVRATGGQTLLQNLCQTIGCTVLRGLNDPQSQLFLVSLPPRLDLSKLLFSLVFKVGIINIEIDGTVSLIVPAGPGGKVAPPQLLDRTPIDFAGDRVWNGYVLQPAANVVRANEARQTFGISGNVTVALIDTGIDPNHPALRRFIVPGYDFTRDQPGYASELADVNQSTAAVVDGGTPVPVNSSTMAVLNQSTAAVVDGPGLGSFGHGTMVAGIVHMVAPGARLMPLKAFQANGQGYLSDIIRAIYWGTNAGAKVINMSFSTPAYSQELKASLDYATSHNVICVASAGNDGKKAFVFPAALSSVMGVASTDLNDHKSSFSNYGKQVTWVAAPGEGIVSTYPFNTYAAGWGTSFSAPFVAGTGALLLQEQAGLNQSGAAKAIAHAKPLGPDLGNGRLDIWQAVGSLK